MNNHWLNKMKSKAIRMRYQQKDHDQETPTDYFHRKIELLQLVHDLMDLETIMEIMNGVPREWLPFIDTSRMLTVQDLLEALKYHEETLIHIASKDIERRLKALEFSSNQPFNRKAKVNIVETNFVKKKPFRKFNKKLVGAHKSFTKPQLPKRDDIVSKGKTPEQKGARPCHHCRSGKHWDFDHPFNGNDRKAKTFLVDLDLEAKDTLVAYENCYYQDSEASEDEEEIPKEEEIKLDSSSEQEDFPSPLE